MFAFLDAFVHLPWMLAGLAVLAIPPIIHLLNRRRYDVIDWGAMQFLQVSEITRRRLMLEELLLMLVRMGLLGVLVVALAGPFLDVALPPGLGPRPPRDVVLVIDGSASMSANDEQGGPPPAQKAVEWARAFLDELSPEDGVALLVAREQILPLAGSLTSDRARLRDQLAKLPPPAGSASWPAALGQAFTILESSQKRTREVILLGDGQRFSWADPDTLFRWELLVNERGLHLPDDPSRPRPRVWAVNLAAGRAVAPPNYALGGLSSNRPIVSVDREVRFRGELLLSGQTSYSAPYKIRLEIDGKHVRDLPPPGGKSASMPLPKDGKVPFSFSHRFPKAGSHLVSVLLEPDPPPEARPAGYVVRDRVPGDNRQDFAVEVLQALPVLLVDGGRNVSPAGNLGSDFLRDALAPARDRQPVVAVRVVGIDSFDPAMLTNDPRPRVLVLHDVPRLTQTQASGVASYLAEGGGVLVTLGPRSEPNAYNEILYRGGEGWLPARIDGIGGDEARPEFAVRPDTASFTHPVLELFRKDATGGLGEARFPRWWKLSTPGKHAPGTPVGQLRSSTEKHPFFVERAFQSGRVLACAVPLDASWGTNLIDLQAFVPLVHEAVYYLAGARSSEFNLRPGQPLRYRIEADANLGDFQLQPPVGLMLPLSSKPGEAGTHQAQLVKQERGTLLVCEGTRDTGVYQLQTPAGDIVYYVVPPDARESDLTPSSPVERAEVGKRIGIDYEDDREAILQAPVAATSRQELWLWLLLGFIALLCMEVWMTRRLVLARG